MLMLAAFFLYMLSSTTARAASTSGAEQSLTEDAKKVLLTQLKRENPSVSPYDTCWKRIERNFNVLLDNPLEFYTNADRAALLLKYVAQRELSLDDQPLSSALTPPQSMEMQELFEADQKAQIALYRRTKRIPEHPNLPQLYYMMSILGLNSWTESSCTPCVCLGLQTLLGCYTT